MIETLLGTLFGGVFRMLPEVLKWLDRKDERKHELSLLDKNLEADRLKAQSAEVLAKVEAEKTMTAAELSGLIEGVKAQAVQSGVKWVDGINSLIRPLITFWWVIVMYSTALSAQFLSLREGGSTNIQAILALWGPDEKAVVASIISFWFVDRSLRYKGLK